MRETIDRKLVIEKVNAQLAGAESQYNNQEHRFAVIGLAESILLDSETYQGFRYLTNLELPAGTVPGIRVRADGSYYEDMDDKFFGTDETRRAYI